MVGRADVLGDVPDVIGVAVADDDDDDEKLDDVDVAVDDECLSPCLVIFLECLHKLILWSSLPGGVQR